MFIGFEKVFYIPSCFYGEIAQLVERGIEDPSVGGSIPSLPTNYTGVAQFGFRASGLGPEGREFESLHPYH